MNPLEIIRLARYDHMKGNLTREEFNTIRNWLMHRRNIITGLVPISEEMSYHLQTEASKDVDRGIV